MSFLSRLVRSIIAIVVIAVLTHIAGIYAVPSLVMSKILNSFSSDPSAATPEQRVTRPPITDAEARRVVMPSPDLLYTTCRFDVSRQPVRISGAFTYDRYWSLALYGARTDMFYVTNDKQQNGAPVDLLLVSAKGDASPKSVPEGVRVIIAPTDHGMMLMRMLVGYDEASRAKALAARQTVDCKSFAD